MHRAFVFIILATAVAGCGSAAEAPPFASPAGWGKEIFSLPPSFASFFPYRGKEIIRFAPGWGSREQADYWSYAYLWMLEDSPDLSKATMEKALTSYYTGLLGSNIGKRHIPESIVIPVTVKLFPDRNKTSDWTGTINMLDYMAQQPVTLNIRIRALPLSDPKERCLFIELSPVVPGTGIWQQMDTLVKTP